MHDATSRYNPAAPTPARPADSEIRDAASRRRRRRRRRRAIGVCCPLSCRSAAQGGYSSD